MISSIGFLYFEGNDIVSIFLLMVSYKIHGACFPLISGVSSDTNFLTTALQKQTLRSLVLEQKALCHVTVDRQEDTEQPHAVFYHFLDCKRAYLGRNWWPTHKWSAMSNGTLAIHAIQYLGFHFAQQRQL